MDKGLIILMSLAVLLTISILLAAIGMVSNEIVSSIIALSLVYHTGYTLFAMIEWSGRKRIRNKRRGNMRPPHRDKKNPWN